MDSLAIMNQEEFGHPGCEWNYWVAIPDVEVYKQNGRATLWG
jgi:hypothetical protein